jgi:hypothetical protein
MHQNCRCPNKQAKLFNELRIITGHEEGELLLGCGILIRNGSGRNKFLFRRMKSIVRKVLRSERNAWH